MGKGLSIVTPQAMYVSRYLALHFGEILGRERLHGKYYKFP